MAASHTETSWGGRLQRPVSVAPSELRGNRASLWATPPRPVQSWPLGGCRPPGYVLKLSGGRGPQGPGPRPASSQGHPCGPTGPPLPRPCPQPGACSPRCMRWACHPQRPEPTLLRCPASSTGPRRGAGWAVLSRGLNQAQMGLRTGGPQVAPQSEPLPPARTSAPQGLSRDTACRAPRGLAWARSSSQLCALQTPSAGPLGSCH